MIFNEPLGNMHKINQKTISIVTPCFNEELNVDAHFNEIQKAIAPFKSRYNFEHIYTDNCSLDATFAKLAELAHRSKEVKVIRFSRNIGAGRAMFIGLSKATGDAIVLIQADLQDPPSLVRDFIFAWEEGYDVAYGKIQDRNEVLWLKKLRTAYYKLINSLSDVPIAENAGEFRLTSRRALNALLSFNEDNLYIRGAMAYVGFPQKAINYTRSERKAGKSSISFLGLINYALNGFISTTVVPIRAISMFGLVVSFSGFLGAFVVVLSKLIERDSAPHGFTTLVTLLTFFSGVIILSLGVIGEYIKKIYTQSLHRPRGFIQDEINFNEH